MKSESRKNEQKKHCYEYLCMTVFTNLSYNLHLSYEFCANAVRDDFCFTYLSDLGLYGST